MPQIKLVYGEVKKKAQEELDGRQIEEENKRLDEENKRLEEETAQLELRNKLLAKNTKLRALKKDLEDWNKQLQKRKVDDAFDEDDEDYHHHHRVSRYAKPPGRRRHSGIEAAVKKFFSSPHFAVAGASSDPHKYGHKVFVWYLDHKLSVTPINPSAGMITTPPQPPSLMKRVHLVKPKPSSIEGASKHSLSIITPPEITRKVLEDAKKAGVAAVWLQPGSFDRETLEYARREWPGAAVGGYDIPGSAGEDGWCVLVDGAWGLGLAGKQRGQVNGEV